MQSRFTGQVDRMRWNARSRRSNANAPAQPREAAFLPPFPRAHLSLSVSLASSRSRVRAHRARHQDDVIRFALGNMRPPPHPSYRSYYVMTLRRLSSFVCDTIRKHGHGRAYHPWKKQIRSTNPIRLATFLLELCVCVTRRASEMDVR